MKLQLEMPEQFADELNKSVQAIYADAIQTARQDIGVIREYLSINEVCELLGISRNTLNDNFIEKGLPKYKIGRRQFIKKSELNEFISKHQI